MQGKDDPFCTCFQLVSGWDCRLQWPNGSWYLCGKCGNPAKRALNECDECGRKFKGVRPNIKIAYTCPDCE